MKKTKSCCAKCTPLKAFHLFYSTKKGECELCKKPIIATAEIPNRYFKKSKPKDAKV